jgi:uncharacterized membrane protein
MSGSVLPPAGQLAADEQLAFWILGITSIVGGVAGFAVLVLVAHNPARVEEFRLHAFMHLVPTVVAKVVATILFIVGTVVCVFVATHSHFAFWALVIMLASIYSGFVYLWIRSRGGPSTAIELSDGSPRDRSSR